MTKLVGRRPGPTLALLGGVHGDEDEGVLAVHRVFQEVIESDLAGTLRAVAPANPTAWVAQSRADPISGEDLARSFPGDHTGSRTAMLAAGIADFVIDGADLLIDLHSAGVRYEMPLLCGYCQDGTASAGSRRAARVFGAPLIWVHERAASGRSLSAAIERGIPAIYAECSGGGSIRSQDLDAYVRGVLAVMVDIGMLPTSFGRNHNGEARWVYGDGDLDEGAKSGCDGYFVSTTGAGKAVGEGEELGRIYDYQGRLLRHVLAPRPGAVMFLRRQARTQADDVLYVLARLGDRQE